MPNLSRRFKLEYTDSSGVTQVFADTTGEDNGTLRIDRHWHQRRKQDPDILKVWLEGENFGNIIPTRKSEFGTAQNNTDEPEILYKQYNPDTDSFDTKGRFYAKNTGTINENGKLALKLFSFMKFTEGQQVNTPTVTTDIETALNEVLPSGYVADVPAGATVPSVDGYSINARREKGYHELTRDYKFVMNFTAELDANNDYLVKFEPEGFGGTVDTIIDNSQAGSYAIKAVDTTNNIYTVTGDRTQELVVNQEIEVVQSTGNDGTYTINNLSYDSANNETDITVDENISDSTADGVILPGSQAVFKSWEKDKTDAIINKVTVEGTNSNGATVNATATNQTQIDNFGEKFLKVKRGYLETSTDAQNIAEKYLVPGLNDDGTDITAVPENGTVKTTVYTDNILNDSVQAVSNKRNIDDTYTVASQKNYWPEAASILEFEFESENLEEAAREAENLRDERGRLFPGSSTDVGNQGLETGDALSNTTKDGGVGDDNDRNNDLSNVTKDGGVGDEFDRDNNLSNVTKSGTVLGEDNITSVSTDSESRFGVTISGSSWTQVSVLGTSASQALYTSYYIEIKELSTNVNDLKLVISDDSEGFGNVIFMDTINNAGGRPFVDGSGGVDEDVTYANHVLIPTGGDQNRASSHYLTMTASGNVDIDFRWGVNEITHEHDEDITTDNNSMGLTDDINTDNNAMGLTDDISTDDNLHGGGSGDDQHGGSTDAQNINVTVEDKTDRS